MLPFRRRRLSQQRRRRSIRRKIHMKREWHWFASASTGYLVLSTQYWLFPAMALLLTVLADAAPAAEPPRWNILFCFADDWGRYASCYAKIDGRPSINDAIKTPNVDRVAREGVLFRHAFVNSPSCTPCRSSLVSGRYFFNCGRGAILQGAI